MIDDVQAAQAADHPAQIEGTLSVQEAAVHYGVTEKTIRRRIKAGSLRAVKHAIAEGFEWRVYPGGGSLDSALGTQSTLEGTPDGRLTTQARQVDPTIAQALQLIERMHDDQTEELERLRRDNQQLAGQVGFMQAKLQEAERQIALLMAPKDEPAPAEEAPADPPRHWWRRLFGA